MERETYWNERIQEVEVQKNKLVWEFAQAEVNLKNDFTAKYGELEERRLGLIVKRDKNEEVEESVESEEAVETNNEAVDEENKVSDLPGGSEGDGEAAVTN